jgi:Rrf2 family protein
MRLSARTDYGLRAALDLAARYGTGPVRMHEIASRQGIPPRFLEQLMVTLRRSRLVESRRGVRGGYLLARPPEQITMRDVVEALEGKTALAERREPETPAAPEGAMVRVVRDALAHAEERMFEALGMWSLADLLARGRELGDRAAANYEI